ncbi:MAG: VOC family protein [Acidimicrobiales bacterium]|nr:VOC family protein [Acidimicrobiales bacterium]
MGLQAKNPYDDGELIGDVESGDPLDDDFDDDVEPIELRDVHHVAIAVADLDEALADYRDAFGVTVDHRETIAEEDVEVALLSVGGSRLQLMAPADDDSWLVEFLDGQASGLNHVGFSVDDCAAAMAALESRGYEMVDDEPKPGPNGTLTAYVHPPDQPGTLLQLVQG